MSMSRKITSGLRSLFRKERVDQELNDEFGVFLEMAAAPVAQGCTMCVDPLAALRYE